MTLDAAAAEVDTVRQVWNDWERGRRIPNRSFMAKVYRLTRGQVRPDHFYDLPPIGQLELPIHVTGEPDLFHHASEQGEADAEPELQAAA